MVWPYWWQKVRERATGNYHGRRAVSQIEYLAAVPGDDQTERETAVTAALLRVADSVQADGGVTADACAYLEEQLAPFARAAKSLTLHCVGHAHLDMNWMWGYDETVVIVMETMRTALRLLEEYPEFRFSQSQGAIYEMIERYEPELLPRIQRCINEGRWELAATQWTETDMNLPSGESLLRHTLYTVRYLQDLFGVDRDRLRVAFMPDTFGHSAATPEVFAEAGVKYVYHGRGSVGPFVSRWEAPSGRSVLAYQDPRWYNESVESDLFLHLPELAAEYGISDGLSVYGVGDHGGGPTRRDLERIIDMQSWPLAPRIIFSTYHDFFAALEQAPTVRSVSGERNPVFTGCYSSQSRIKAGNLAGQRALYSAELLGTLAGTLSTSAFHEPWRNLLFTHFHDILPGSGVSETREHALALYQQLHARVRIEENRALRALSSRVQADAGRRVEALTEKLERTGDWKKDDRAEGAGVGFAVRDRRSAATQRWGGPVRPFLVVSTNEQKQTARVEVTVWDWDYPHAEVVDADGTLLASQIIRSGEDSYWSHTFVVLLVELRLEAWQYQTIFVRPVAGSPRPSHYHPYGVDNWLVEKHPDLVLDNGVVRLELDPQQLSVASLYDYEANEELLGTSGAGFLLDHEEPKYMSSWITHRTRSSATIGPGGTVTRVQNDSDAMRQSIELAIPFGGPHRTPDEGGSHLRVKLELDRGSRLVRLHINVSFREVTTRAGGIPRLGFSVTTRTPITNLVRDIPVLTQQSKPDGVPVAAQSWVTAETGTAALLLVSHDSQSFTATPSHVTAVLLRGSNEPDPTPEVGEHTFRLALGRAPGVEQAGNDARTFLLEPRVVSIERPTSADIATDVSVAAQGPGSGTTSLLRGYLARIDASGARVLAVKPAEEGSGSIVVRCASENAQSSGTIRLILPAAVNEARIVNALERPADSGASVSIEKGNEVAISLPPGQVVTVQIMSS